MPSKGPPLRAPSSDIQVGSPVRRYIRVGIPAPPTGVIGSAPLRRWVLIAFTAAAALSCQPQRTLDLVVTPGDLLIVAKVDIEEGSISLSKIVADRSVIPAHRKASEVLITWSLPKGSLVDSEGAPLDPAELVLSRTSTLGCGHCPIQSRVAPQIFDPGANCPLPGWLDAPAVVAGPSANPEHVVAELAPTLRLHRRGACPCERLDPTIDGGTIDARYLDTWADVLADGNKCLDASRPTVAGASSACAGRGTTAVRRCCRSPPGSSR